jgi:hypothetical protein
MVRCPEAKRRPLGYDLDCAGFISAEHAGTGGPIAFQDVLMGDSVGIAPACRNDHHLRPDLF